MRRPDMVTREETSHIKSHSQLEKWHPSAAWFCPQDSPFIFVDINSLLPYVTLDGIASMAHSQNRKDYAGPAEVIGLKWQETGGTFKMHIINF